MDEAKASFEKTPNKFPGKTVSSCQDLQNDGVLIAFS